MITALVRRELNIKALARRTLLANAISGAIATPLVLNGFGAWGLVVQYLGGVILTLILTIFLIGWPVKWAFDRRVVREMISFGAPVTGVELLTRYNKECPKIFIGFFLGVEALGIFAMAMRIMMLLHQLVGGTLHNVVLPVLSQVNRNNPERLGDIYLQLIRLAGAIILPIFILVIVLRESLVLTLLGPTWIAIVPVLAFLCAGSLLINFNSIDGATLVSMGKPKPQFMFSLLRGAVGSVFIFMAIPYGVVAVGAAFFLRGCVVEPMQLRFLLRLLGVRASRYFDQVRGSFWSVVVMAAFGQILVMGLQDQHAAVQLLLVGSIALSSYVICLFFLHRGLVLEFRSLISRKGR